MEAMNDLIRKYTSNLISEMTEDGEYRLTLTIKQTAKLLGINQVKMYELARTESFPSIVIGRRIIIPVEALLQWLEKEAWKNCN